MNKQHYVYLIQAADTNHFKIGITANIERRRKQLQTANADDLVIIHTFSTKYNRLMESTLQRSYQSYQKQGEWFELTAEQVDQFLSKCQEYERNFDYLKQMNNPFI